MVSDPEATLPEIKRAFLDYDRQVTIKNIQVGCLLGMVLMPAGIVLDYFVYPEMLAFFFKLRMWCSVLIGVFWLIVITPFGHRHCRELGVTLAMFPAFFMSWMIYASAGADSPYYAGLNLVLLFVGFVLQWTFTQSVVAITLVLLMYLGACLFSGSISQDGTFVNNLYFLVLTGIIVATGNYFHSQLRFREFSLRYELDRNRQMLEASNRKLVELDEVKSRFFANISHELRTPLTLLLAPLEALLHERGRASDRQIGEWLQTMQANGMRLLKLINDLLDLVRLESGKMEVRRESIAVPDLVRGLASSVQKVAEDKRIYLETSLGENLGWILADVDKVEKIILNLVFNALKFTPAGGRVILRAHRAAQDLVLEVKDTGMGLSPEQLPFLFQRFWQADTSAKRRHSGAGIGLALVKELVEIQGGTVAVESQEGKGTTFTVRLPCVSADAPTPARPKAPEAGAAGATARADSPSLPTDTWLADLYRRAELFPSISPVHDALRPAEIPGSNHLPCALIADDEPDMLRFLKSQLSPRFRVLEAIDGQQAVEKAAQFLPDIVLCDIMMPEKDGMQVCRELRERTPTRNIPIVLLTARADDETKLAALTAGANDFLTKPFSTVELEMRLRNLVAAHQLQRELARQNQVLAATLEQLKDTETQLVQSEKLASLGRMSAGIIHEINNPLNFVKNGLYTLRGKEAFLDEAQRADFNEILRDVEDGINRVRNIVSDLRTFTHPDASVGNEIEVGECVTLALRLLSNEWKDRIVIEKSIPAGQTVWGNRNKLVQVLVNLLQNSFDALQTKAFAGEKPTVWIEAHIAEGKREVSVRDNGPGIALEHQDRIFEPFFTTKDVGQGMGLGLSICYRIMQEFQGRICVRSQPGEFTQFILEFPEKMAAYNDSNTIN